MSANTVSVSSEVDIFASKPIQSAVFEMTEVKCKPIASVDQGDLEFLIPSNDDTYKHLDIKLFIRGKFTQADGTDFDNTDILAVTNNILLSLFSQCSIVLIGVTITQVKELYNYQSIFETLLTNDIDPATWHLTNAFWYLDEGDLLPCDATAADAKNQHLITRWNRIKQTKEVEHCGRIHSHICNVHLHLLPGV